LLTLDAGGGGVLCEEHSHAADREVTRPLWSPELHDAVEKFV